MIIQRLVITSFGGEFNRVIDFSEDVNLIMASNNNTLETIRAFMDAIFFGQSKEDQKKYRPDRVPYSGSIFIENNDRSLKINRNFLNNEFEVLDSDGNNVTEEYCDEYGELSLLQADSVYPKDIITIPDADTKDKELLERLYQERSKLNSFYDYEALIQKRDELFEKLDNQKQLKHKLKNNINLITTNEEKLSELNQEKEGKLTELDQKILNLEKKRNSINIEIDKLHEKESNGRAQILQRNIQGNEEQLKVVQRRLSELNSEEIAYQDKLDHLKSSFTIDRDELKKDHDEFLEVDDSKEIKIAKPDPFVEKLSNIDTWFYTVLIILGGVGITLSLMNPQEFLTRIPIFIISFISVFIILFSILIIYIRIHTGVPVPITNVETVTDSSPARRIMNKYNLTSSDEFNKFYSNAKKVYSRIDDLEADLKDIREEIDESRKEESELLAQKEQITNDLSYKFEETFDENITEQISELKKDRNRINAQIDELREQKAQINTDSTWKIQEYNNSLEEANMKLQNNETETNELLKEYNELNTVIDRYETNLENLDNQIADTEKRVYNKKREYINSYANPDEDNFKINIAKQFGFGLQNNIRKNNPVPYIVMNPLKNAGEINEILIEKFNNFLQDHQAIVFSTSYDEQEVFKNSNLRHNGIFLLESKF